MASLADKYPRISDMKAKAIKRMPHFAAEYLLSGTGYDRAMDLNQEVLKNIFLTPRYLKGTVEANLKTKLFNRVYSAPFGIAPIGMTSLIWPGAEIDLAKLSTNKNIPYTLSTVACASIEKVAPHLEGRGWFQLYPPKDKNIRDDLLKRASDSGYEVLVITSDIPASSRRERLRMAGVSVPPKINFRTIFQAAISPSWSIGILRYGMPKFGTMNKYQNSQGNNKIKKGYAGSQMDRYLDWKYLEEVRNLWKGPIVLKGLMDSRDALKAKDYVDAMWRMLQLRKPDDFVIATGKQYTVRHFINISAKYLGIKIKWIGKGINEKGIDKDTGKVIVRVGKKYFRPTEVETLLGDARKAKKILKWKPKISLNEMIKEMVECDLELAKKELS